MHDEADKVPLRISDDVALASLDLLPGVVATRPPLSVVFTGWLSMTPRRANPTESQSFEVTHLFIQSDAETLRAVYGRAHRPVSPGGC